MVRAMLLPAALLSAPAAVSAQSSTKTYTYDALGRLILVETTGGQTDGEARAYEYDKAGNRIRLVSADGTEEGGAPSNSSTLKLVFNGRFVAVVQK